MLKAYLGRFDRHIVSGWVLDTTQPDAAVAVGIYLDGQLVAETVADMERPDLAKLAGFGHGRHGLRFEFPTPLVADKAHVLCLYSVKTGDPLPGCERVLAADLPSRSSSEDRLTPILVTGTGRTGTTLLMSLLANNTDVVAAELMPYETRQLAYYAVAHDVLTHPADTIQSTHQDDIRGDGFHIGFNPYHCPAHEAAFKSPALARDFALSYAPSRLDLAFSDIITEYYRRLKRDTGKADARFFAEKNDNLNRSVRMFARRAFGEIREIVTVRDPRDVLCSALAYFKSVEPERAFSDVDWACKVVLKIRAERSPDVFLCQYEKLLACEPDFLDELSEFLGTRVRPRPDGMRADMFQRHATSVSPAATLERWRTDLPPDMLARATEAWLPFLEAFGYSCDLQGRTGELGVGVGKDGG